MTCVDVLCAPVEPVGVDSSVALMRAFTCAKVSVWDEQEGTVLTRVTLEPER